MKYNKIAFLSLLIVVNVLLEVLVINAQFNGGGGFGYGGGGYGGPVIGRPVCNRPGYCAGPGFGGPGFGYGRPPYYGGGFYGRPWRPWRRWGYGGGWYG